MGYAFRTRISVAGTSVEALLDGGAVLSLLMEELLVEMVNGAIVSGLTPESEDWPIAGLEQWGKDLSAHLVYGLGVGAASSVLARSSRVAEPA